ncbi:MAG: hypothetical protein SCH70_12135 [Candidatus Methanoperedens sp.]|nr:hypothetical protein [Candidatus Methanoperedens sp.]
MFDDKAQLHTMEGVAAATLILLVILYAIDATSMTPLTSSTSGVHMELELRSLGTGILNTLDYAEPGYRSKINYDISGWNGSRYVWNGEEYAGFVDDTEYLDNNLTGLLRAVLVNESIAHNLELVYITIQDNATNSARSKLIYNGDPSDNAVIVSRKIILHDGDINETSNPYNPIKDIDGATNLWNIVDVNLILWRL